ncbi:hypothetical protein [Nostocoides sp.]|uniref:hypothetical protein n=1 Tax=Nostocoides sp. TaxID=1917966 RepID=UPI002C0AE46D|nr:hypothetical protein [Tetrasphaera sp.]
MEYARLIEVLVTTFGPSRLDAIAGIRDGSIPLTCSPMPPTPDIRDHLDCPPSRW